MNYKYILFCFLAISQLAHSQSIDRGPYLQLRTQSSIQIRFNTDSWCNAKVKYGLSPGNLDKETTNISEGVSHIVNLTGLQPNTIYYYAIYNNHIILEGTRIKLF